MSEVVKGILRAISSGLQIPTIIILILLILLTIVMLGSFFAEMLTERKSLKLNIPKLVDDLQGKTSSQMKDIIATSSLLTRQKIATQELISRVNYPEDTREALARQLIADEEARYGKIVKITDLTARVAPMFGLMGTLIPLGPGLIALGEGDAATLSDSLLIAFDTTVAGLISGALSYIVSGFRKGWYEEYMIGLETIMETILDVQNQERSKALQQKKDADAAKAGQTGSKETLNRPKAAAPMSALTGAPQQKAPAQPAPAYAPAQPETAYAAVPPAPAYAPAPPAPAYTSVTSIPTFAQANSKTIVGPEAQKLQEEVKAAEAAIQNSEAKAEAAAAVAKEMEQIQSLDDLLDSFSTNGGQ